MSQEKAPKKYAEGLRALLAAVSRCNIRGQAREKRQIYLSRDLVRLTATNSISQTKAAVSRCNIREQAREKGEFIFRGTISV